MKKFLPYEVTQVNSDPNPKFEFRKRKKINPQNFKTHLRENEFVCAGCSFICLFVDDFVISQVIKVNEIVSYVFIFVCFRVVKDNRKSR